MQRGSTSNSSPVAKIVRIVPDLRRLAGDAVTDTGHATRPYVPLVAMVPAACRGLQNGPPPNRS